MFRNKMLKIFLSFNAFPACRTDRPHNGLHALGIRSTPLGGSLPLLRQNISQLLLLAIRKKRETALLTAAADTKVNLPDFPTTFLFIFRDRFVSFLQKSCSCP